MAHKNILPRLQATQHDAYGTACCKRARRARHAEHTDNANIRRSLGESA